MFNRRAKTMKARAKTMKAIDVAIKSAEANGVKIKKVRLGLKERRNLDLHNPEKVEVLYINGTFFLVDQSSEKSVISIINY